MKQRKIILEAKDIPEKWYNIVADMPNKPLPALHPGIGQPAGPDDYFAGKLVKHEITTAEIEASISKLTTPEIA